MTATGTRRTWLVFALCIAIVIGWPFALHRIREDDVYAFLGPYGAATVLVLLGLHGVHVDKLARGVAIGVAVGLAMTAGTYAAYAVVVRLVPGLASHVTELYAAAHSERIGPALAWTCVVICAEELLWRSALLETGEAKFGRLAAIAISLATYTAVQLGSGSWVVALAAFVCGAIWTAERVMTRTLVASLVSHLIWTVTVIHLLPVTSV
ncbi:hypothetical protein BH11MYX1_BH11MYX1_25040 [soil metagenome]